MTRHLAGNDGGDISQNGVPISYSANDYLDGGVRMEMKRDGQTMTLTQRY